MAVSTPSPEGIAGAGPAAAPRPHRRPDAGAALLVALLGAAGYAAFASGAGGPPEEAWLQVVVALLALAAAVASLGPRALRPGASPVAVAGLGLLVAYVAWTGTSLIWSVAPDRTWEELNRALAYALVLGVAIGAASGAGRAIERVAIGWLLVAVAVALYAVGGKVAPGVLDHAVEIARLRAPLEYWNALGLVCVLAAPVAIRLAGDRTRRSPVRIAALLALFLLLSCLGMTLSRGGLIAMGVALVVLTVLGGGRLRGLLTFTVAALAAAPSLALVYSSDALSANDQPLGERIDAGLLLGGLLLLGAAIVVACGIGLLRLERRVTWSPRRSRRTWTAIGVAGLVLALGGVGAVALSDRGLGGSLEHAVDKFTDVRGDPVDDPGRLLSVNSGNRWAWWQEGFGAWADRPVLGWGAGSFPVSRRLYRVSRFDVLQPHSLPVQLLAETGLVGALLLLGALALLVGAAVARVRALPGGRERDLAVALLAAAAAWLAHSLIDWDWELPGVALPLLLFLGVLVARRPEPRPALVAAAGDGPGIGRVLALSAACLLAGGAIVSAVLPAWSDAKSDDALEAAASRPAAQLEGVAADAERAARLNPLAARPLLAAAAVAEARGRLLEARGHLLDAVRRDPYSLDAWSRLTSLALRLADREGVRRAANKTLELDPGDRGVQTFVGRIQGFSAPPQASPTATGTPLSAAAP